MASFLHTIQRDVWILHACGNVVSILHILEIFYLTSLKLNMFYFFIIFRL